MINEQDLQSSFDQSGVIQQARQMLDAGQPIEFISQNTGLDRQVIENLLLSNQQVQTPPIAPPPQVDAMDMGIMSNPMSNGETESSVTNMNTGNPETNDVMAFLNESLGVDKGDDETMTLTQALNSGSVAGIGDNSAAFSSFVDNASMFEDLADPEKLQIYKDAAASIIGEPNYESLIEQPDKVMPYLAAGLSLINSGERGDDWGAALGKAFITGKSTAIKEDSDYAKSKAGLDAAYQSNINNFVTSLALTDMKDRMAYNKTMQMNNLKAPKMYDFAGASGTYADKETIPLDESTYAQYAKAFPGMVRPAEDLPLKPYTVSSSLDKGSGSRMNVFLDQDQLRFYQNDPKYAGNIRAGHDEATNMKLYSVKQGDGSKIEKWLTPEQFNDLPEDQSGTIISTAGQPVYVYDKLNGGTDFVSSMELTRNGARYEKISAFSGSMTSPDGTIIEFGNDSTGSRATERQGIKQFDTVKTKLAGIDRAVGGYFISADNLDSNINNFVSQFPDQADLIFDNMAGRGAKLADNFVIGLKGFGNLFQLAPEKGGSSFYVGETKVSYDEYKNNIISSSEFESFRESPLAKFLEESGITGARLDAALFDMAMIGAGSYSTEKGLDLRAISDFETRQFMKMQGAEAKSLKQFQAITNDFRTKLINRNIAEIERTMMPSNLYQIKKKDGTPDLEAVEVLKEDAEVYLNKLLELKEKLSTSIPDPKIKGNSTFVADASIDPDNEQVKALNISIPPTSVFAQNLGITETITTDTVTPIEGSYRDMINKYAMLQGRIDEQDAYVTQLEKNLTKAEFEIFKAHVMQAQKLGL